MDKPELFSIVAMNNELENTLAHATDGSEDTLTAFVGGDPIALIGRVLKLGTLPPRIFDPVTEQEGWDGGSRLWIEWSVSSTCSFIDACPPGSWDFDGPLAPDFSLRPDPLEYWLLRISTDVRVFDLIEENASLDVTAPALILREIALADILCVMESGRAPGRVNAVTNPQGVGGTQILFATGTSEVTPYFSLWENAINSDHDVPDIAVRSVVDLDTYEELTYAVPVGFLRKSSADTAPGEIAKLLVRLADEKIVDWEP